MKIIRLLVIAAALIAVGTVGFAAQQTQVGRPYEDEMGLDTQPGRWNPPSREERDEVRKKIEAIRIYRLTGVLKLDEKTSAQLASLLGSIDMERRDLMDQNMEAMKELRSSLKAPNPDVNKLKSILERLEKNHREMVELKEKELKGLKSILTVEQRARYVVFDREFMREMRSLIAAARGNGLGLRGGPGSGKTGPGPGVGAGRQPENR
jgi:Spy/CpxP family protein refolding chaperone